MQVKEPITSIQVTVLEAGWSCIGPTTWTDEAGDTWSADSQQNTKEIEMAMQNSLEKQQWSQAEQHRLGAGIGEGIYMNVTQKLIRKLAPVRKRGAEQNPHRRNVVPRKATCCGHTYHTDLQEMWSSTRN